MSNEQILYTKPSVRAENIKNLSKSTTFLTSSSKIEHFYLTNIDSNIFTFVKFLFGGNLLKELFSQNWGRVKVLNLQNLEKENFAHFVNFPLSGNPLKDLFWRNWRLLKTLNLYSKSLQKQTLLILWVSRFVEIYSLTSFDKTCGF